jgi:translation elongation factor EF-4
MEVHNKIISIIKTCSNIKDSILERKKGGRKERKYKDLQSKKEKRKKNKHMGRVYLESVCFYILKSLWKKIIIFLNFFLYFKLIFLCVFELF